MTPKRFARAGLLFAALLAAAAPLPGQSPETGYGGATALGLELRKLGTTKRVLMIGAHPDDEDTQLLGALVLGQGADAAYLSLTRGEGGQNGIGAELQEALGLLRSEELLAARRLDGAAQFFTRAYDFGFSKNADETFRHWPKDSVLADAVAVIRAFRPDVVVSVWSGTPRDGHGHHQAAGIVAREAFHAAGDPARFPEQLARGLRPHAPAKLYQSSWFRAEEATVRIPTGTLDPLLGRSHSQVAAASRSRHRSQDMGRLQLPGPRETFARRLDGPAQPEGSLFAGVDSTLNDRAGAGAGNRRIVEALAGYDGAVRRVRDEFNPLAPDRLVPGLAGALTLLERADSLLAREGRTPGTDELRFHIAAERAQLQAALARAAGLELDAVAEDDRVVPGQSFELEITLWNGGNRPAVVYGLEPALPAGWEAAPLEPLPQAPLAPGALLARKYRVRVPAGTAPSEPYYLRAPRAGDAYRWPEDPSLRGLPFEPPELRARAQVELERTRLPLEREASYRGVSSTDGEFRRPVQVVPAVSLLLEPAVAILPTTPDAAMARRGDAASWFAASEKAAPLTFTVRLTNETPGAATGTLRFELPAGWRAEPAALPLRFTESGERRVVEVAVVRPAGLAEGAFGVRAVFETGEGERLARGSRLVDYAHVRPRPLYREAVATVRAFDVRVPANLRVGYIMGAADAVPASLAQLGITSELLDPAALAAADLSAYDAVVVGSRAYEHRADLAGQNRRLLEYVERGGTLIVQYNQYEYSQGNFAPYPLTLARPHDRVTDETAPVRLLDPAHPALAWPNRITERDFQGWVQERGLYFPRTWDERYTPLLEMRDPGEDPRRGGLLVAKHGRGTYVYTGLAFFRQLPVGVPGAYRLFANLLSLGVKR